jgi:hypothetical protein
MENISHLLPCLCLYFAYAVAVRKVHIILFNDLGFTEYVMLIVFYCNRMDFYCIKRIFSLSGIY